MSPRKRDTGSDARSPQSPLLKQSPGAVVGATVDPHPTRRFLPSSGSSEPSVLSASVSRADSPTLCSLSICVCSGASTTEHSGKGVPSQTQGRSPDMWAGCVLPEPCPGPRPAKGTPAILSITDPSLHLHVEFCCGWVSLPVAIFLSEHWSQ